MNGRDLFNAYLDSELTAEQFQQLEAWINTDPRHASEFLAWIGLQAWTREALQGELLQQVLGGDYVVRPAERPRSRLASSRAWVAALAASMLIAAVAYWIGAQPAAAPSIAAADDSEQQLEAALLGAGSRTEPRMVATLSRLQRCQWSGPSAALRYGQQLIEGTRVALESGVVCITFESGAEAVLEGPCDFTVDNAMHATIRRGRVAVTAPKRAYGFRVRSPNAEVIDLGTEFGVNVDDGGNSEVHVFSGEVLSRSVGDQSHEAGELIRVTANSALRFAGSQQAPSRIASDNSLFPVAESLAKTPAAVDAVPTQAGLALWLAADSSVRTQEGRRVVAWSDILFGDNSSSEDALQPEPESQPMFAPKGINGRPAVRFNGSSSYLVTTPLETTDNQTIFVVCQFSKAAARPGRKRGGQILNYNGPPHRLVSSTYEPGVLQIGEPIGEPRFQMRLGGKLFAGRLNGRDVSEAQLYTSPLDANAPVVLAYRYDLANIRASLWINGDLIEEKPALRPAGVTSRKTIGRHGFLKFFFAGEIGELMIFNSALADAELESVTMYLSDKFEITLKQEPPGA